MRSRGLARTSTASTGETVAQRARRLSIAHLRRTSIRAREHEVLQSVVVDVRERHNVHRHRAERGERFGRAVVGRRGRATARVHHGQSLEPLPDGSRATQIRLSVCVMSPVDDPGIPQEQRLHEGTGVAVEQCVGR